MAWRDSRRGRGKLFIFSLSIVLGVGAMAAIGSFGRNLSNAANAQAKSLLGADLQVSSRRAFTEEHQSFLEGFGEERSRHVMFASMLAFPESGSTRLVQARAIEGGFPFYGHLETEPPGAVEAFRTGRGVLVEHNLMLQFEAEPGDLVQLGELEVPIAGALLSAPGENIAFSTVAPRVYFDRSLLDATGLYGQKSIARHYYYYRFADDKGLAQAMDKIDEVRREHGWGMDDVDERKEELQETLGDFQRFLSLAGFVALLLGAVGVASAIQTHIRGKLSSLAVLRCLGASGPEGFAIYLIQALMMGLCGVGLGLGIGVWTLWQLPAVLGDYIPLDYTVEVLPVPLIEAGLVGLIVSLLFALFPLLETRHVSPLQVLRRITGNARKGDPAVRILRVVAGLVLVGYALHSTEEWTHGLGFVGGLAGSLLLLLGVSKLVMRVARKLVSSSWPFVVRHALAGLYRPNNRTGLLTVALGLGFFLVMSLYLAQHDLARQMFRDTDQSGANAILFDVQSDQLDGVTDLVESLRFEVMDSAPIVTMKIKAVKGRTAKELMNDRESGVAGWALRREYRSTYRADLSEAETLLQGDWVTEASFDDEVIPISLEDGIAENLKVGIGDEIVFDIQGLEMVTRVANLRDVEWQRIQANFFIVFPTGVLEEAPGFHILSTRVDDARASAKLQRAVVAAYPNVSVVDLLMAIEVIEEIVGKITMGLRFMALFTVVTGFLVLIATTLTTRYQRIEEAVLLRLMGASGRQVLGIQFVEYALLGLIAATTGTLLAIMSGWALARFVFEAQFQLPVLEVSLGLVSYTLVVTVVGLLGCWGITHQPPLRLLREDS